MESVTLTVKYFHKELRNLMKIRDEKNMQPCLEELAKLSISQCHLDITGVDRTVTIISARHAAALNVGPKAALLREKWTKLAYTQTAQTVVGSYEMRCRVNERNKLQKSDSKEGGKLTSDSSEEKSTNDPIEEATSESHEDESSSDSNEGKSISDLNEGKYTSDSNKNQTNSEAGDSNQDGKSGECNFKKDKSKSDEGDSKEVEANTENEALNENDQNNGNQNPGERDENEKYTNFEIGEISHEEYNGPIGIAGRRWHWRKCFCCFSLRNSSADEGTSSNGNESRVGGGSLRSTVPFNGTQGNYVIRAPNTSEPITDLTMPLANSAPNNPENNNVSTPCGNNDSNSTKGNSNSTLPRNEVLTDNNLENNKTCSVNCPIITLTAASNSSKTSCSQNEGLTANTCEHIKAEEVANCAVVNDKPENSAENTSFRLTNTEKLLIHQILMETSSDMLADVTVENIQK